MRLCGNLAEFSPNREIDQWEGKIKDELKVLKKNSLESFGLNWKKKWSICSIMFEQQLYVYSCSLHLLALDILSLHNDWFLLKVFMKTFQTFINVI